MVKIAVIGLPGSGKSTFASQLSQKLNIPVHHLDRHMFESDGRSKDRIEKRKIEQTLVKKPSWIIDGCSISTLEARFASADRIIYFDFPRSLCIWRVFKRIFTWNEQLTNSGCLRGVNYSLLYYIWNFDRDKRPLIETLRHAYPHVSFLIFKRSKDAEAYLHSVM